MLEQFLRPGLAEFKSFFSLHVDLQETQFFRMTSLAPHWGISMKQLTGGLFAPPPRVSGIAG